ncbi:HEAT repeat domain-containing protein [Myxococcus sp. K15C18031901]|uniref:HEAT repeat domain-containing protein n=1 Tax=Myxococcus dinghuensis TaxID=2906761 RepID=UPI0020A7287B|nr:HEAT repeat domain-containing protein [Myxococcus dinghuensis]MCP3104996.1 HEAT repeat domain-containing protein [Myxococcus dinghuensis]
MRRLLLTGLLLAATAQAAAPAPPKGRPAPPAQQVPAPVQAPTKAPPAEVATPASDDTALLRGLLWAARPAPEEIRAIAIEDLALLGDARALDSLATLLWDPNPRTQQAVLRAVALFQHPRAEEILGNVVRHPRLPDSLKIQALNGLVFQRTATARRTVQDAAMDTRLSSSVQTAARAVATQWNAPPAAPR